MDNSLNVEYKINTGILPSLDDRLEELNNYLNKLKTYPLFKLKLIKIEPEEEELQLEHSTLIYS
jgi:hypothetical protein